MMCDDPFFVTPKGYGHRVPVPCGRCPPCKKRRVDSWVFRLMQHTKVEKHCHFVTITYDTRHVPISPNGFMTLRKSDLQKFWKRLRKANPNWQIKYYACGEYGSKNRRPHFHAIVFGVPDSSAYARAWTIDGEQLGAIHVGVVTRDSIAYTMKYIDKDRMPRQHARDDRHPEFSVCSKGLGENYLTSSVVSYHKADLTRLYATTEGGYRIALPRYYRERIYDKYEKKMQAITAESVRQANEARARQQYYMSDPTVSYETFLDNAKKERYRRMSSRSQQKRNL